MNISRKVIIALVLATIVNAVVFNKEANTADTKALCLNGAQAFVYTEVKQPASPNGIIVYFMPTPTPVFCGGNSFSASLERCITIYDEITSFWTNQLNISSGILVDPAYQTWAKVIIPNCDGALYQGYATNATQYKGRNLYFRGNSIVKSNLQHIFHKKFNASKINSFIFAGSGFGASGALIWSRYFYDQIVLSSGKNKHFGLILDSIPFSYNSYKTKMNEYEISLQNLLKIANVQALTPFILCTLRNEGEEWRCFKLEETYFYLNFPVMLIDSQYSQTSVSTILQIDCINSTSGSLSKCSETQRNFLEEYRSSKMIKYYSLVNFHQNSVWSISCSAKSFLNDIKYDSQSWQIGGSVQSNVHSFISQSRISSISYNSWPSNEACSEIS